MVGDMGRYTQFQVAQAVPIAAANEGAGGTAGLGAGLGAGLVMAQQMMGSMQQAQPGGAGATGETKFCVECGKSIIKAAKFCPECGKPQA